MSLSPVTPRDLFSFHFLSHLSHTPDGKRLVWVDKYIDREENDYYSHLWIADLEGDGEATQFTWGKYRDHSPRWSPDGRELAFLSNRSGHTELWTISTTGGGPRQRTFLSGDISHFAWNPKGGEVCVCHRPRDGEAVEEERLAKSGERRKRPWRRHIRRLQYRFDGQGFYPETVYKLFRLDLSSGGLTPLTDGDRNDHLPEYLADGETIVFLSHRGDERDIENRDLWSVTRTGGEPVKLSPRRGPIACFAPSPQGDKIAFIGDEGERGTAVDRPKCLWILDLDTKETTNVSASWDRTWASLTCTDMINFLGTPPPQWSADGDKVLSTVSSQGNQPVYQLDLTSKEIDTLTPSGWTVYSFSRSPQGHIAAVASSTTHPGEVYLLSSGEFQPLTSCHRTYVETHQLASPEKIQVDVGNGDSVDTWILLPPGFDSSGKYPMILEIHGGPHTQYGETFFHEFQCLASRGYVVVYANPRGSIGYGNEFAGRLVGQWTDPDYDELMKVVDHVVSLGYIDEARMGVTGGSYGGYMTNWILSHNDRFQVGVTQRCVSNLIGLWAGDIGPFFEYEWKATPWENPEKYIQYSPFFYVDKITAPLLILHSEWDYRCPIEQAEQLYLALKWLGRETEMIIYREESHGLSRGGRPWNRVDRLEAIVDWMDRYLNEEKGE